ncbi:fibrillin-1 isoform X4 [Odocoileus virginianus]|uniref:Fibrillin-1 isoform X4 n=1 Tax=Odocoileus virginianus TaxID=9874 RepID=A0ABM4IC91_ODOVR
MRRGGLLEVALGFTVLLASYTSHGADTNLEAGNVKETRANRAKRRGGGGHDALKGVAPRERREVGGLILWMEVCRETSGLARHLSHLCAITSQPVSSGDRLHVKTETKPCSVASQDVHAFTHTNT